LSTGAPSGKTNTKRPADFDHALLLIVAVVSRRPDDAAVFAIDGDECSAGFQGAAEELPENFFFVAVVCRMLLPDERI
jgi:hypothetical protein